MTTTTNTPISTNPWPVHERACHLELSGLTHPGERCGGCHYPAGQHRAWKHRAKTWPEPEPASSKSSIRPWHDLMQGRDARSTDASPQIEGIISDGHARALVEIEEARDALGHAWFAGAATLAEGIRRKTAALEKIARSDVDRQDEIAAAWAQHPQGPALAELGVSLADLVKGLNEEIAALTAAGARTIPSFVPATPANVERAVRDHATGSTEGLYVVALPADVREVAQSIYRVVEIFWLNPERSSGRWRAKSATHHVAAAVRHAMQHVRGRVLDEDTKRPHLHLAGARMLLAISQAWSAGEVKSEGGTP